jgi:4-amino-4-deoxy-L-arabinose transferase-like glycosyltransferase
VQDAPAKAQVKAGVTIRNREAPTRIDQLVENLADQQRFTCDAPLSDKEEETAHEAPLFPIVFAIVQHWGGERSDEFMRWLHCVLGALTSGLYFLFARRAFHCTLIATLAGLLTAFYPFWIINTAELNDGVIASFVIALCLMFGAHAGQTGSAFTGLLYGLALALAAQTRAAFLPFAAVALLWFLWDCKRFPAGWFAGLLALLGFLNGLAPWSIRNWQAFEKPIPVTDTTYLHLWMGNNPKADGTSFDEEKLRKSLPEERRKELLGEANQAKRYNALAQDVWNEVKDHPTETLTRRMHTTLVYFLSDRWLKRHELAVVNDDESVAAPPDWLHANLETILQGTLLGLFAFAAIGWRFSHAWRRYGRVGAIAVVWLPLPYILSHAESLSGPRLPLDGMLLCLAAYALLCWLPGSSDTAEPVVKGKLGPK